MTTPTKANKREMTRWDPMAELDRITQPLSALLGEQWQGVSALLNGDGFSPQADLEETDHAYVLDMELPGVRKQDVNVEVVDQRLIVTGERSEPERKGRLRHRARSWGRFYFEVRLPDRVDPERVQASLKDGVLHVEVQKAENGAHRRVEVQ